MSMRDIARPYSPSKVLDLPWIAYTGKPEIDTKPVSVTNLQMSDASTLPPVEMDRVLELEIDDALKAIFVVAKYEEYEIAEESRFARELQTLIKNYPDFAIRALSDLIIGEQIPIEIASDALSFMGQIEDPTSHLARRRLMELCLFPRCRNATVRYGAILGLAYMDDPLAIPPVKRAIDQEAVRSLKRDLRQLLAQLQITEQENA